MAENIEETSYDILEWFPIRFCQDVFKHLSGKDVIEASAVNKEWNKLCTESQQVKKLKLFLGNIGITKDREVASRALEVLQNGKRKYQNIEIWAGIGTEYLPIFALGAGLWKSVVFRMSSILDEATLTEILRIIEPTVEEISMVMMTQLPNKQVTHPPWTFPCLKSLDSINCMSKYNIYKCFSGCTTLAKFHWSLSNVLCSITVPSDRSMLVDIRKMLRNNHDLKDLYTSGDSSYMEYSTDYKFKLQKLRILLYRREAEILYIFLETQAETLETLEVDAHLDRECLELILSRMPGLSSFSINLRQVSDTILSLEQPLPVNTTVSSLELQHGKPTTVPEDQIVYETLIRAFPSIKHLKCDWINDDDFLLYTREIPALESIETSGLLMNRFPEGNFFPNIKKFKAESYRDELEEPTGDGNFATLVRGEMRKHFALYPRRRAVVDSEPEWSDD